MSTDVQADWQNREFVEMIERSCRQSVGFLNRFYQSAKYRLAVLDQRLTRVERKLDYIEASLENADVTQRGGKPVPFGGSLFEPESRVEEVKRKLDRRRAARGVYTDDVIRPKRTIQKVLTIDSNSGRATFGGGGGVRAQAERKEPEEAPRRQQPTAGGAPATSRANAPGGAPTSSVPPGQPGPPPGQAPAHARARAGPGRQPAQAQPGAPPQQQPGRNAGRRPRAAPGEGGAPGEGQPRPPQSEPPAQAPPSEPEPPRQFPHGDPTRIDMQTIQPGTGGIPKKNSQLEVAYTGWLMDGKQFIEHREVVQLGAGQNIAGLEQALIRMTEGQRCKLWIPCNLAYGPAGAPPLIPPSSDLTFDIKLIRIAG